MNNFDIQRLVDQLEDVLRVADAAIFALGEAGKLVRGAQAYLAAQLLLSRTATQEIPPDGSNQNPKE